MTEQEQEEQEQMAGTYEEALQLVGVFTESERAQCRIERGQVRAFAVQLEDARADYWSEDERSPAPPGVLMSQFMALPWRPDGAPRRSSVMGARVDVPGATIVNVSTETTFLRQLRVGDLLTVTDTLTGVSPLKSTKLGKGHFITTRAVYTDEFDEVVAENINTLFRFDPAPAVRP